MRLRGAGKSPRSEPPLSLGMTTAGKGKIFLHFMGKIPALSTATERMHVRENQTPTRHRRSSSGALSGPPHRSRRPQTPLSGLRHRRKNTDGVRARGRCQRTLVRFRGAGFPRGASRARDRPARTWRQPMGADTELHGYERYAADLDEFATKLDLRDFVLIGHSMGGAVALTSRHCTRGGSRGWSSSTRPCT